MDKTEIVEPAGGAALSYYRLLNSMYPSEQLKVAMRSASEKQGVHRGMGS